MHMLTNKSAFLSNSEQHFLNHDTEVGQQTLLLSDAVKISLAVPITGRDFSLFHRIETHRRPTQSPVRRIWRTFLPGVKRPEREAYHSPQTMTVIKNACVCAYSTAERKVLTWCSRKHSGKCRHTYCPRHSHVTRARLFLPVTVRGTLMVGQMNSEEQRTCIDTNSHFASQEILRLLWDLASLSCSKGPPLDPILNQTNPARPETCILVNVVLVSTPRCSV